MCGAVRQCGAAGDTDVWGCAAGDGAEEGEAGGSHAQAHQEAGGAAGCSAPEGIGHPPATHSGKQQVQHEYRTFCLIFSHVQNRQLTCCMAAMNLVCI